MPDRTAPPPLPARADRAAAAERKARRAELNRLVRTYARLWQLPPECWGTIITAAHERAEALVLELEID